MNDTSYAKIFASMFTGSMYGAGVHVFATWAWVLAHKDENGLVEINPNLVASELGCGPEQVVEATAYLTAPDPDSRTPEEEGRRMVQVSRYGYRVVNHDRYREAGKDRRAYWREWRAKNKKPPEPDDGDGETEQDGATVAQRGAQPNRTHTDTKLNPNTHPQTHPNPKADLGFGLGTVGKESALDLGGLPSPKPKEEVRRQIEELCRQLSRAIYEVFPRMSKYKMNTTRRILRHFIHSAHNDPTKLCWFRDARTWLDEACADGKDEWRLWLHLVKKHTTYAPRAKQETYKQIMDPPY